MDAFFAAVEQRDRPELRGRPVIVGADPKGGRGRGVVSTASYEARPFGVGSAMPISQAWRACPHGVYLRPDMERYARESHRVMDVLRRFSDRVEPVSIDEAFLDVTAGARALGPGETVARQLKDEIHDETGLTASVGVATSKLVAKVASDMRKPDGLVVVPPGEEAAFLAPLHVRRLWGVGPRMEEQLARLGVVTIGDLAALEPDRLERRLGTHGHDLRLLARGIDEREVHADSEEAKSIGQEHTFGSDTADPARLRALLLDLADGVAARLRAYELKASRPAPSPSSTATSRSGPPPTPARFRRAWTPETTSSRSSRLSSARSTAGERSDCSGCTRRTSAPAPRSSSCSRRTKPLPPPTASGTR
jgi:nucleotidyltransferase/DNA polymerase involved in DNA repair